MDKWLEDAQNGRTHEPSNVTVERDGLGRQLSELPAGAGPAQESGPGRETVRDVTDRPVFVDASGRRSKKLRRAGWVVTLACAGYAVTLAIALVGGSSSAPWLPLPGHKELPGPADQPTSDRVDVRPGPVSGAPAGTAPGDPAASPAPMGSNGRVLPGPSGSTSAHEVNGSGAGSGGATPPAHSPAGGSGTSGGAGGAAGTGGASGTGGAGGGQGGTVPVSGGPSSGPGTPAGDTTGGAGGAGGGAGTGGTPVGSTPSGGPTTTPDGPVADPPGQRGTQLAAEGTR
ncbi:hypothetical protein [Streptomyces sp. NPDC088725]|uniref:hypothetical protein n=1 Tax=Streptomyces sp. NPDC088725 TaxID=3365873 RepID=UPI00381D7D72